MKDALLALVGSLQFVWVLQHGIPGGRQAAAFTTSYLHDIPRSLLDRTVACGVAADGFGFDVVVGSLRTVKSYLLNNSCGTEDPKKKGLWYLGGGPNPPPA